MFITQNAQHRTVQEPVYRELIKRMNEGVGVNPCWCVPKTREERASLADSKWPDEPDWYVYSCGPLDESKGNRAIYLPHGIGDENAIADGQIGTLIPGKLWKDLYIEKNFLDDVRFPVVGCPRLDILSTSDKKKKEIIDKWKSVLDLPYDRTIMFSGFYYYGYERENLTDTIHDLVNWHENFQCNLIIKPHISTYIANFTDHHLPEPETGWFNLKEAEGGDGMGFPYTPFRWHTEKRKQRGVNWMSAFIPNMVELYLLSDLLIGGESSACLFEFMSLDKPTIGMLECDGKDLRINPTATCSKDGLHTAIGRCLNHPNEFAKERAKVVSERIHQPDGKAAERCADAIIEMIIKKGDGTL